MTPPMDEHSRMERMLAFTEPRDVYVSRHTHEVAPTTLTRSRVLDGWIVVDYCDQGVCGVEVLRATEVEVDGECFHPEHGPGHHDA